MKTWKLERLKELLIWVVGMILILLLVLRGFDVI